MGQARACPSLGHLGLYSSESIGSFMSTVMNAAILGSSMPGSGISLASCRQIWLRLL